MSATQDAPAFAHAGGNVVADPVKVCTRGQTSHARVGVKRVADVEIGHQGQDFFFQRIGHAGMRINAAACGTHLALIKKCAQQNALGRAVQIGIGIDDLGVFAAQL